MKKLSLFMSACLIYGPVQADIYKVFWPEENMRGTSGWDAVKIVNVSSNTILDGSMAGVYTQDLSSLTAGASTANSGATYQMTHSLDAVGSGGPTVIDFSGENITFRAERGIAINPQGGASPAYVYDVVYKVNATTGAVLETKLVASSEAEQTLADAAGFTVDLEESDLNRSGASTSFQSYASNVTTEGTVNIETKGGLVTEQLSNPDGTSLLRKEDDGTVHIGQNSIVLSDEAVSASGNDEVYSSSGTLQLGNNDTHATVIKGTLTVNTPTASGHAANKGYVDTQDTATLTSANSYADSIGAMAIASSQLYLNSSPNSALKLGVGLGSIGSQNAVALGVGGFSEELGMNYSLSVSYSNYSNKTAVGAGINWDLN